MIFLIWGTSAWVAYRGLPDLMAVPTSEKVAVPERPDTLFIQAQREYLGGHWEEAEGLLRQRIQRQPRDMESRLLLATLLRHSRRLDEAAQQLDEMDRYDEAIEWSFESGRERQLIDLIDRHETAERSLDPVNEDLEDILPSNNDGIIREKDIDPETAIDPSVLNKMQLEIVD
jgi:tetratricopeptide (TPR) repeat protein